MNIKEIFDKATSENKALTFEEFEALAKANKAKFTDLSEGNYVSKQKYDDDIQTRDTQISTLNDTIATRDTDLAELQTKLSAAGTDAEELKKVTTDLTALQVKYDEDTKALSDKLSAQAYQFSVRDFANSQKFSSAAAKREFERAMMEKNLPMENGNIMGANDWLKEYMKDNKDSFVQDTKPTTPPPQFAGATDPKGAPEGKKMSLSEMMKLKNENPNAVISFE